MLLERLLEVLVEHTVKLDELAGEGLDLGDWRSLYLVLHTLQVHAQTAIDYLLRACALLAFAAATPMDCVAKLESSGFLEGWEADVLRRMIRFRNIVVHEYGRIDVGRVEAVLETRGYRSATEIITRLHKRLSQEGITDP